MPRKRASKATGARKKSAGKKSGQLKSRKSPVRRSKKKTVKTPPKKSSAQSRRQPASRKPKFTKAELIAAAKHLQAEKRKKERIAKAQARAEEAMELARIAERARIYQERYEAAVSKFKPRKSDYGKIVFVTAGTKAKKGAKAIPAGQRLEPGKRYKAYAIYVTEKGKLQPLTDLKDQGIPIPRRKASINLRRSAKTKPQKEAAEKWVAKRIPAREYKPQVLAVRDMADKVYAYIQKRKVDKDYPIPTVTVTKGKSLNYYKDIAPHIANQLETVYRDAGKGNKHFNVKIALVVRTARREIEIKEFGADFKARDLQQITPDFFLPFVQKALYAHFAMALRAEELVLKQSALFIRNLKQNKGKARSKWTRQGGMEWDKADFADAEILRVDYDIAEIKVYSSKTKD